MDTIAALVVATAILGVGLVQFALALRLGDRTVDFADEEISMRYGTIGEPGLQASFGSAFWLIAIAAALAVAAVAGMPFTLAVSAAVILVLVPTVVAFSARFIAGRTGRSL